MEPKHQSVTNIDQANDEFITIPAYILIQTLSYLEALGSEATIAEKRKPTSETTFMADLISAAHEAWKATKGHEVTITINGDKYHNPSLIRAKYLADRKDYGLKRR